MSDNSLHDDIEIALLEEIAMRARAALVSNDSVSREESIKRARVGVQRVRSRNQDNADET